MSIRACGSEILAFWPENAHFLGGRANERLTLASRGTGGAIQDFVGNQAPDGSPGPLWERSPRVRCSYTCQNMEGEPWSP